MARVALFGLAVVQLGFALHYDEHSATDLTGTCAVCVQLEQFDYAISGAHSTTDAPPNEINPAENRDPTANPP